MKFFTRVDTDLPAGSLFDLLANFSRSERALAACGAMLRRIDPAAEPGTGAGWTVTFTWRGRPRFLRLRVARLVRPSQLVLAGRSDQFDLRVAMTVMALGRERSRLLCETVVCPLTMRARLLVQMARLARADLDRGHDRRIADYVAHLRAAYAPRSPCRCASRRGSAGYTPSISSADVK